MKKFISICALIALSAQASFGADGELVDKNLFLKTKEITLASQTLKDGQWMPIETNARIFGDRGFFGGLLGSPEENWHALVSVEVKNINCFSMEMMSAAEKDGFVYKSRISDSLIIGLRDGVEILKKNGAKYIFLAKATNDMKNPNRKNHIIMSDNFHDVLAHLMSENNAKIDNGQYRTSMGLLPKFNNLPEACFKEQSIGFKDVLAVAGTVTTLAVGVLGAKTGNVDMASLAAHGNKVVDNTSSGGVQVGSKELPALVTTLGIKIHGTVAPDYFEKNMDRIDIYSGNGFPIEDVEKELSRYMDIPHDTKIKKI